MCVYRLHLVRPELERAAGKVRTLGAHVYFYVFILGGGFLSQAFFDMALFCERRLKLGSSFG